MYKLGEATKIHMRAQNITTKDIAEAANLEEATVASVIYGRSRKLSLIKAIEKVLGIDLVSYLNPDSLEAHKKNIDADIYFEASNVVHKLLKTKNVYIYKDTLDTCIMLTYKFITENRNLSNDSKEAMVQGMIEYGLHNLLLAHKFSNNSADKEE